MMFGIALSLKLADFKRRNVGTMPSDGSDYYQRLEAARRDLQAAELELAESRKLETEYSRQLGGLSPTFGVYTDVDLSPGDDDQITSGLYCFNSFLPLTSAHGIHVNPHLSGISIEDRYFPFIDRCLGTSNAIAR